jgi:hypothetical protein
LNCIRSLAAQRQYATLANHSRRFPHRPAFLVRQDNKFIEERVCRGVVPAEDMGNACVMQRKHQRRRLPDLACILERVICVRNRFLRIAEHP